MNTAGLLARSLSLLACGLASACLVTDKPEFGEINVPAQLSISSPTTFARAPDGNDPRCGQGRAMAFEVKVLDANVTDSLEARLFINGQRSGESAVQTTGQIERGTLQMCPRLSELSARCNHVELVVSQEFLGSGPYGVKDETDIGKAEWWVLARAEDNPMASATDCVGLLDGGVP